MSPKRNIDRGTLKRMVELDLQQLADKYYTEHGVDIAVSAHILFGDLTGSYLCGFSHDDPASLVFNLCFMAAASLELLREQGIPPEMLEQVLGSYNSDDQGELSPLQRAFKT